MEQKRGKSIFISLTLLLVLSIGVIGICMKGGQEEKKVVKIGVCTYKASDTFIGAIVSELEQIAKEEEQKRQVTIKVDVSDGKESQTVQNEQFQKYIDLAYDVICVNVVDRTNVAHLIDQATYAGIPIIFFNREPVAEDLERGTSVYYIGSSAKESAVLQGELILEAYRSYPELIDKNGDGIIEYVMLEGEAGHQDTIIRTEYATKTLEEAGLKLQKIGSWSANFDRNQAAALMEQYLEQGKEKTQIELIISNNDDMALGAADALAKYEAVPVAIVGIDGVPQGCEAVDEGVILGTIMSNQALYARALFSLCEALIYGTTLEEPFVLEAAHYIWIPWEKYTK